MKLQPIRPSRTVLGLLCGMVLASGVFAVGARADEWNKMTILTVNQPIQIRETLLDPGQYVLKLYDSSSERHVVQIFNRDQTHIINTVIAVPAQRLEPTSKTLFTFWETPPGTSKALRDWYFPGDLIGQEFPYPKHLQQVAMLMPPEPMPAPEPAPAAVEESHSTEAETATPEAVNPEPAPAEQPAEIAQNTAPPAPAETTPAAPPTTETTPQTLPKTGSPYPAFGVAGAALLGLAGLLRMKRRRA